MSKGVSFRDRLKSSSERAIYVRTDVLPDFVAFKILKVDRIANKSKPGTMSNVLYLEYKAGLKLQYYADSEFQKMTEDEIKEFNDAIKNKELWYAASYGLVGDNYIAKILSQDEFERYNLELFEPAIHKLKIVAPNSPTSSPVKRSFTP